MPKKKKQPNKIMADEYLLAAAADLIATGIAAYSKLVEEGKAGVTDFSPAMLKVIEDAHVRLSRAFDLSFKGVQEELKELEANSKKNATK
jgi:hypothetical protein